MVEIDADAIGVETERTWEYTIVSQRMLRRSINAILHVCFLTG
jgi:hypothetical protein